MPHCRQRFGRHVLPVGDQRGEARGDDIAGEQGGCLQGVDAGEAAPVRHQPEHRGHLQRPVAHDDADGRVGGDLCSIECGDHVAGKRRHPAARKIDSEIIEDDIIGVAGEGSCQSGDEGQVRGHPNVCRNPATKSARDW